MSKNFFYQIFLNFISVLTVSKILLGVTPVLAMGADDEILENSSPIRKLPNELLVYSFSFLEPKELGRLALVSKEWQSISEEPVLWKRFGVKSKQQYIQDYHPFPLFSIKIGPSNPRDIKVKISFAFGSGPYSLQREKGSKSVPHPPPFYQGNFDKYSQDFIFKGDKENFIYAKDILNEKVKNEIHGMVDIRVSYYKPTSFFENGKFISQGPNFIVLPRTKLLFFPNDASVYGLCNKLVQPKSEEQYRNFDGSLNQVVEGKKESADK